MRNFRKFDIWKDSIQLVTDVYQYLSDFPEMETYGLVSQMSRSAISIPSNIAEGSARNTEKDFKRFLEIAIGSSFELETQIIISIELGLGNQSKADKILIKLEVIQKRINSLITKLKAKSQ
jgi:four helix bundle protein